MLRKILLLSIVFSILIINQHTAFASGSKTITRGQNININWIVTGASSCNAFITPVSATQNQPTQTDTWTNSSKPASGTNVNLGKAINLGTWDLNCNVPGYSCTPSTTCDSARLTVNDCGPGTTWNSSTQTCDTSAPTATISDTPDPTYPGQGFTVTWGSTGATSCTVVVTGATSATYAGIPTSGSQVFNYMNIGTYTFTNTCTNSGTGVSSSPTSITHTVTASDLTAGIISPTTYTVGASATIQATITNSGATTTNAGFYTLFQYATDSSGTGATDIGNSNRATPLVNGNSFTASNTFTVSGPPGTYYARACADKSASADTGTINESNENNNCSAWTAITINSNTPTASISDAPDPTRSGSSFTVTWSSTNSTSCSVVVSGSDSASYPGLATSGSQVFTYTNVGASTFALTCTNGVASANASTVHTVVAPDLTAGAISPTTAVVGTPVTLQSTITNGGATSTAANFNNFIQVATAANGGGTVTDLAAVNMTTLAAGGTNTTSKSYTFPSAGTYSARACADKNSNVGVGTISEYNAGGTGETNNCGAWVNVVVSAAPLNCSAQTVNWGSCSGNAGATNNGNNAAVSDAVTPYTGSATFTCNNGTFNLQAGSTCVAPPVITLIASPTSVSGGGSSTLTRTVSGATSCSIDNGIGSVSASNGSNPTGVINTTTTYILTCSGAGGTSTTSATVTVGASPDLTAGALIPTTAVSGNATTLSASVSNIGGASTGANFNNFIQVATAANGGGTVTDLVAVNMTTLAAGAQATTTKVYTFPSAGTYSARACADKSSSGNSGTITEWNAGGTGETNNCGAWATITVTNISGSLTLPGTCTIASGASSCSVTASWTTTNATNTVTVERAYSPFGTIPGGTGNSGSTNISFAPTGSYTLNLRHNSVTLDSKTITVSCAVGSAWDGTKCQGNPPTVDTLTVANDHTSTGSLDFSCSNATSYTIIRTTDTPATTVSSGAYPPSPEIRPLAITVTGSYQVNCINALGTDSDVISYDATPAASTLSLLAAPRTAKAGAISTLTWSITNPVPSCAITASAVYAAGAPTDPVKNTAATSITSQLTGSSTDANDPYGQRLMSTALRTPISGTKAIGKKSIILQYTTDFTLNCNGGTPQKVRVQVTNENEG